MSPTFNVIRGVIGYIYLHILNVNFRAGKSWYPGSDTTRRFYFDQKIWGKKKKKKIKNIHFDKHLYLEESVNLLKFQRNYIFHLEIPVIIRKLNKRIENR